MTAIEIWIPGAPVGKGRGRAVVMPGGGARVVTPQKTRTYEGIVKSLAIDAMERAGLAMLDGPVSLELRIVVTTPDSWPRWKKELAACGKVWPTTKPDSDNIEKAIKDAMNGVVYRDDVQVVVDSKIKLYGPSSGVRAVVRPLDGLAAQANKRPEG
jgi:Holliday junction resolvase RusA-like endonuclease